MSKERLRRSANQLVRASEELSRAKAPAPHILVFSLLGHEPMH